VRKPKRWHRRAIALACVAVGFAAAAQFSGPPVRARDAARTADHGTSPSRAATSSYAALAARSIRTLETTFYNGRGLWRMCDPAICNTKNRDWGADALTNLLYFAWLTRHDRTVLPVLRTLAQTAHLWVPGEHGSSDSVMWDAVADIRLYQATGSKAALAKAEAAMTWLGSIRGFASGACPSILYQWPFGHRGHLKTIETPSNYLKAALLLYRITRKRAYLVTAEEQYALVRRYFLAPSQLYTAYMFDNGSACQVLPGRYFASVNGIMIWAGQALAAATRQHRYLNEAVATARAVQAHLSDGAGIFADLQADNDIAGPLVDAMYSLATAGHQAFAARWLLANASAAGADVNSLGEFGRFFDGPPPAVMATAWQVDGGIALMQAAAALDPGGHPADPRFWGGATFVPRRRRLSSRPVRIAFTGQAIAIMGTIGARCCRTGHASVLVDGVQTLSQTGIWQDMSSPARRQPDQVLFAWGWPRDGHHVITVLPASYDAEEGGSFFAMTGYLLVR
jgi:hypothetical protein